MTERLTNTQRAFLRRQAHDLKPVIQVGKNGLTDSLVDSTNAALVAHELIKVKFMDFKDMKKEVTDELAAATRATVVTIIGNVAVLFRQNDDRERRKVILPAAYE